MQDRLVKFFENYQIELTPALYLIIVLGIIIFTAIVIHVILHNIVLRTLERKSEKSTALWLKVVTQHKLSHRLAFVLQGIVFNFQVGLWLDTATFTGKVLQLGSQLWIIIYILLAFFSLLDVVYNLTRQWSIVAKLPLRGIFQGIKLISSVIVGIMIISLLINKSPTILISGLGAMAAVLMLVFKDPILGLVAGIQLSANNMLNLDDWLEMPKYGADGSVIDIGLTTVKVRNWDNTITTIPTYALVSDAFKNWRGMSESGGRRIKRSVNIDTTSIHFLSTEELEKLSKSHLLGSYLKEKQTEISAYNKGKNLDLSCVLNGRHISNIGTFRIYLTEYLKEHPYIRQDMTLMVRQMSPTVEGLPLEIYAFTNTVEWLKYEAIQADIFDHIFSVIGEFGLRIHEEPSGYDIRSAVNQFIEQKS